MKDKKQVRIPILRVSHLRRAIRSAQDRQAGTKPENFQSIMEHSNIRITMNWYAHGFIATAKPEVPASNRIESRSKGKI